MKKFLSIIITLFSLNANSQIKNLAEKLGYEKDAKLLIIHADDIGVAHSVNQASFDGFLNNSINSGAIMIPCPWVKEVANFSKNNPEDLYDTIIYVANWPKPRIQAWRILLQSRAIENQCYVMGVNRIGEDPSGNVYTGDSLGVDPFGAILSEGPVVDLLCDRGVLDDFRRTRPFILDEW